MNVSINPGASGAAAWLPHDGHLLGGHILGIAMESYG
jgi:hypothetical protein